MTPWLGRSGRGDAPTTAIVFASRRIVSGSVTRPPALLAGAAARAQHRTEGPADREDAPRRLRKVANVPAASPSVAIFGPVLKAVIFDVDFTIARPGPDLGPEGYRRLGKRYGLDLDPARYDEARRGALATLERHPELDHDEQIWVLFTQRIIEGMGGVGDTHAAAIEMEGAWVHAHHFELYDDALPTLDALRARGLKVGLLSNSARDLDEFVAHHGLTVDAVLTSRAHGKTKPHETIFRRMLQLLDVAAEEAVMVGDTVEDDIEGARAVGMRAVLVDRVGRFGAGSFDVGRFDIETLHDLRELPAALGLR
jgi:HAD superfamily hydrolase (TIGR01662 family)